jgi:hypothetical protein
MVGQICDFEKEYGHMKKEEIIISGGPPRPPLYNRLIYRFKRILRKYFRI